MQDANNTEENYLDPEEELIAEINQNLKESKKHLANWRELARESFGFYASDQWDETDKKVLSEQNRPVVTFNRTARTVNAVTGMERQNRQEARFLPRGIEDTGVTDLINGAYKWARDLCDADKEDSSAFNDDLICGYGWTDTRMDYEQNQEGQIFVDRIDPLEMLYDPCAKKQNLTDAKWIARVKEISKKDFKRMWPSADIGSTEFDWGGEGGNDHLADEAWKYENDQSQRLTKSRMVSVVQYQYFDVVNVYQYLDLDGQIKETDEDGFNRIQERLQTISPGMMNNLKFVKKPRRIYYQVFICGKKILERTELKCKSFTFKAVTGLYDRNNNIFFGLVELMKDPQRWANKWLSQIQHIINSNAKGGLYAETGAFANIRKAEQDIAKADSIILLNNGGLQKIQPKDARPYPEGIDRLLQYALQSINDVPGVSLELLGMTGRDQAGYLEEQRKQQGITILAPFFDALRSYRKEQGRVLITYIREYIADGRLVRIVGQEGAQYVPLLRDQLTYEYDVIVDDAPTSTNMKERVFGVLNQIIPMALQAGIAIPPEVLDYAPLPESLTQKWKKMLNSPDPTQQQLKQIQLMLAQLELQTRQIDNQKSAAEIQKIGSDITLNFAKANQAQATGQDEAAQAAQKMGIAQQESQLKERQLILEQARKDIEMLLNHERKMKEAQLNARVKSQQSNMTMQ